MAITVGTDTYVTVAEADTYISNNFVSTDTNRITWEALATSDKEIYLKNSTKRLDRQILRGVKAVDSQALEFPRAIKSYLHNWDRPVYGVNANRTYDYVVESEVSQKVKDAQVEEAVSLSVNGGNVNKRADLINQGVKKFKLGDLEEEYGAGRASGFNDTTLLSTTAIQLMKYYLAGGVKTC